MPAMLLVADAPVVGMHRCVARQSASKTPANLKRHGRVNRRLIGGLTLSYMMQKHPAEGLDAWH